MMVARYTHRGVRYVATVELRAVVSISADGRDAGEGQWLGGRITDCDAALVPDSEQETEHVYSTLENLLRAQS